MKKNKQTIIGLRQLRENTEELLKKIGKGESFTVFKRSEPLFRITPLNDERWEEVVDFTKIQKGGVDIDNVLSRL